MSVPEKKVDICVRNFVFEIKKNTTTSGKFAGAGEVVCGGVV